MTDDRFRMILQQWLSALTTPLALDIVFALAFVLLLTFCATR